MADENKQDLIADFELEEIEYKEETESQAEMVAEGNNDSKIEDYCSGNAWKNWQHQQHYSEVPKQIKTKQFSSKAKILCFKTQQNQRLFWRTYISKYLFPI